MAARITYRVVKDGITPTMQELAQNFPREYKRGLHSLGGWVRKQMAQQMAANTAAGTPIAPLDPDTIAIRRAQNLSVKGRSRLTGDQKKLGGRLGRLFEYRVQEDSYTVSAGWMNVVFQGIRKSAERFQRAELRQFDVVERHWMHRVLASEDIPKTYNRPARPTIPPYAYWRPLTQNGQDIIRKAMYAILVRRKVA